MTSKPKQTESQSVGAHAGRAHRILLVTPHVEPTVTELVRLLSAISPVDLVSTNPANVQGNQRDSLTKFKYYWLDPIATMVRLTPAVWRYRVIITYYHRNGYWLGLLRRLFNRLPNRRWIWVGFAPNPRSVGPIGWLKEAVTRHALMGHDLIIGNTQPVLEAIRARFPEVAERVACVRWGGASDIPIAVDVRDDGYIFCGGRTNRDFETVLRAVMALKCPAVFVAAQDVVFPDPLPDYVRVYRDVSELYFYELLRKARVVVMALKRPDISSGQVVLCTAMTHAKPVVASATAGIEDYVTDGKDAILYKSGDAADLAAKLEPLLKEVAPREALGHAARITYENNFNSRVFAKHLYDAICSVTPPPPGP